MNAPGPVSPLLSLRGASKFWKAGGENISIFKDVDLDVYPGESLAIMGPSGAGKSTLLHVLGLLTSLDKGHLLFEGNKVERDNFGNNEYLRRNIGHIFQDSKLIPDLNVLDNVCVPLMHRGLWPSRQKKIAMEMLEQVGLTDRLAHYPEQLSGGELMRVAIARALVTNPKVLLADEPTGSLDSSTARHIADMLFNTVSTGRAFVIVTHHQPLAEMAKRIISIKDGSFVA